MDPVLPIPLVGTFALFLFDGKSAALKFLLQKPATYSSLLHTLTLPINPHINKLYIVLVSWKIK
jgi:hypothetical protein